MADSKPAGESEGIERGKRGENRESWAGVKKGDRKEENTRGEEKDKRGETDKDRIYPVKRQTIHSVENSNFMIASVYNICLPTSLSKQRCVFLAFTIIMTLSPPSHRCDTICILF